MKERQNMLDNIIQNSMALLFVLTAAYASASLISVLLFPRWSPWFCLLFCALAGFIDSAGICLGQRRLSLAVLGCVCVLSMLFFRSWSACVWIAAGCSLWGLFSLLQLRDRPRQVLILLLIGGTVVCHFRKLPIPLPLAAAVLLLVLTELAGNPLRPNHRHGLRLIPFLMVLEAAILLLPAGEDPFDWSFAIRFGNRMAGIAQEFMVNLEYRFSSGSISGGWRKGYGGHQLFGGRFSDDNRTELTLSNRSTRGLLYLSGEEYASFDGLRWKPEPSDDTPYISWYPAFLNALYQQQITPEEAACFARLCPTQITYQYLRTDDVLRPDLVLNMDDSLLQDMTKDTGSFSFSKSRGKGYRYRLSFMELDYANPYLVGLLQNTKPSENPASYEQLDQYSQRLFGFSLASLISPADYAVAVRDIFDPDLTAWLDTSDISPHVAELAEQIAEPYDNPFDKCMAIQRYLRQYPYSKEADYGGYADFVDAFLFDRQEGFCIHYASAMVVMLRSLGIPAKLVEGYCYDYKVPAEDGFEVPGRYAHTWPEAYIDGFGWVRFEPTASVGDASAYGWNLTVSDENGASAGAEENTLSEISQPEPDAEEPVPSPVESAPSEKRTGFLKTALFFLIVVPALYLFLLLAVRPFIRRRQYDRMDETGRLKIQLDDIRWLIRALFPGPWDNRPLLDYAGILKDKGLRDSMEQICLSYYHLRYGDGRADETIWQTADSVKSALYAQYISSGRRKFMNRLTAHVSLNLPVSKLYPNDWIYTE